jgi:hypothetical protein
VAFERDTLFPKYGLVNGLSVVDAYGGLQAADYEMLLSVAEQYGPKQEDGTVLPHPDVLRRLGVEYLVLPPGAKPDFADYLGGTVWRLGDPLPRAWIAEQSSEIPVRPSGMTLTALEAHVRDILFPDGRPHALPRRAVVEIREHLLSLEAESDAMEHRAAQCHIAHSSPQLVVIEASLVQAGFVVLSDRYDPGWRAFVRSNEGGVALYSSVPILRTNLVFQSVYLPPGRHTVEFRYQPTSFIRGAWISGVSWAILAIGCLSVSIWHRRTLPQIQ